MKKKNYFDAYAYDELKRNFGLMLNRANQCAGILVEYGYPVTVKTISECMMAKMVDVQGEEESESNFYQGGNINFVKKYRVRTTFQNVPMLTEKMKNKVADVKTKAATEQERRDKESAVITDFESMILRVVTVVERGNGDMRFGNLKCRFSSLICIDNGKVTFAPNFDDYIADNATVYCDTDNAVKAMEMHEKAVKCLNQMASYLKPDSLSSDFNSLFDLVDDKVVRAEVNYNLFVK